VGQAALPVLAVRRGKYYSGHWPGNVPMSSGEFVSQSMLLSEFGDHGKSDLGNGDLSIWNGIWMSKLVV
jgi:hypothetical protein